MGKYIVCDKCIELVEYTPEQIYEGGTTYIIFRCPNCGYVKKISTSHIHYGLDGKK